MANLIIHSSAVEDRDFVVIHRAIFRDNRLSYKAKGLLGSMLSRDESTWDFSVEGEAALSSDGRDSIRSALRELEKNGYLTREQSRDDKGRLSSTVWHVYDRPHDMTEGKHEEAVDPRQITIDEIAEIIEIPGSEKVSGAKKPAAKKPAAEKNTADYESEFEEIWKEYPRKQGKKNALKAFVKARKKGITLQSIQDGIERYIDHISSNGIAAQYIKQGSTWFNQECWNDEYEIPKRGNRHDTDYRNNDYNEFAGIKA